MRLFAWAPALPFAAGGEAMMDAFLWVAIIFAGILAFALSRWALNQVLAAANRLPWVGGTVAGMVSQLRDNLYWTFVGIASAFANGIFNLSRDLVQLEGAIHGALYGAVNFWLPQFNARLLNLEHDDQVLFRGWIRDLYARAANAEARLLNLEHDDQVLFRGFFAQLFDRAAQLERRTGQLEAVERTVTAPAIAGIQAMDALLDRRLAVLEPFWPLLRLLDQLEHTPAGGQVAVRDRLGQMERDFARDHGELLKLLGLGVIAAAGATAVSELARIGRNPCGVCPGLDLSDLEGRLAAVEVDVG